MIRGYRSRLYIISRTPLAVVDLAATPMKIKRLDELGL